MTAPALQSSPIRISFADLTHTGRTVDAHYFPLACGFVASYAIKTHGDRINVEIFKYPDDFSSYLSRGVPHVASFSNYSWSFDLCYRFASLIKKASPSTIIVFGGPNYPTAMEEQRAFLNKHKNIDFYIDGEGEIPFSDLLGLLLNKGMDPNKLKNERVVVPGVHYAVGDDFVHGGYPSRIKGLDTVPSPYLSGLLDKFFDSTLFPLMQTQRGCPYSCAFCHDGLEYLTKLSRFSPNRIEQEISYIHARHQNGALSFADDNFGIYPADIDIAHFISDLNGKYGWPTIFDASSAKNAKKRTAEISRILGGVYTLAASVQSTDPEVLALIKRTNVPWDLMVELIRNTRRDTLKVSEVILCLPGDTKEKHFKSVLDLIDIGMDEIRMYQYILLPGTEASSREYRQRFSYETSFRVMPRCIGRYTAFAEAFPAYETHEVCIGHGTLPHADYKACRRFNLLVEIFNNASVFGELMSFLGQLGIARSRLMLSLYDNYESSPALMSIIGKFESDEKANFWLNEDDLKASLANPDVFNSYLSGQRGVNQILAYRIVAHLQYTNEIYDFIFSTAKKLMGEAEGVTPQHHLYLNELRRFIFLKKGDVLSADKSVTEMFSFDFVAIADDGEAVDPLTRFVKDGVEISFCHSDTQRRAIEESLAQFGCTPEGLGHMAQRIPFWNLYKTPSRADHAPRASLERRVS